jgi:hypothetical protein
MPTIQLRLQKPHKAQQQILSEAKRFNLLKCGRRFGKTQLSEELAIRPALDGFPVGYWTPTYKDVSKVWESIKYTLQPIIKRKDEQLKQIHLITGGSIDFWSMEDANSGRGFAYKRAIMDECEKARNFEASWKQAIRPTLTDYVGDAWFLSTPKFGQTYFKELYRLKEKSGFENWMAWTMTSYDNPYLDKAEIDEAKRQYDELTFNCEYLAQDVDVVGRPFAYSFQQDKHVRKTQYNPTKELLVSFDFNCDPIVAVTAQLYEDRLEFIRDFTLSNSDIYELCDRIKASYPNALLLITGDATGHNRSALAKGNINYYTVIQQKLGVGDGQMMQPNINPAVSDRRVLMNSLLQNFNVAFDPINCQNLIKDMKYVEVDDKGEIKKDRSTESRKADHMDAAGYLMNTHLSWFLSLKHNNYVENNY